MTRRSWSELKIISSLDVQLISLFRHQCSDVNQMGEKEPGSENSTGDLTGGAVGGSVV